MTEAETVEVTKGKTKNPFKGMLKEVEADKGSELPFDMENYLQSLSLRELKDLLTEVNRTIVSFEDRKRREALAALEAVARDNGFSLGELVGGGFPIFSKGKNKERASVAPKYYNPHNKADTWSGRGRKPLWFAAALNEGKKPEDMAI